MLSHVKFTLTTTQYQNNVGRQKKKKKSNHKKTFFKKTQNNKNNHQIISIESNRNKNSIDKSKINEFNLSNQLKIDATRCFKVDRQSESNANRTKKQTCGAVFCSCNLIDNMMKPEMLSANISTISYNRCMMGLKTNNNNKKRTKRKCRYRDLLPWNSSRM
jgi:hypothetical protein